MKRYGMMGGTFNPIHLAHLYIAYEAKEVLELDKVIFMVAGNPPHKKESPVIDSKYRNDMVKKAIEGYEGFEISDYEIKKNGYSYTYETLQYLKSLDDVSEVFFIAGADSLMDIEKWRNTDLVLEEKYNAKIILLDVANIDISSSMIRERIAEGRRVDFFLPEGVMKYISENNLYRRE